MQSSEEKLFDCIASLAIPRGHTQVLQLVYLANLTKVVEAPLTSHYALGPPATLAIPEEYLSVGVDAHHGTPDDLGIHYVLLVVLVFLGTSFLGPQVPEFGSPIVGTGQEG